MLSPNCAELHRAGDLCLAWDPLLLPEAAQYVQRAPHDIGSFGSELQVKDVAKMQSEASPNA